MSTQSTLFDSFKKSKANVITYNKKGEKNSNHYKQFKNICRMTQMKLKDYLIERLCEYYNEVYADDGFIYVKGINSNVLLTAHMDTVHEPQGRICTDIYEYYDKKNKRHILSSPQGIGGDDRCGIYAIIKILETTEFRPYIIFCEDEEIGGVGSAKFCKTVLSDEVAKEVNFMIEIDRANANDAVFYEETNEDFQKYVMEVTGTKEAWGSFSDICNLSEETKVSSFNISSGYYNAHTTDEYVVMEELETCIDRVIKLIKANKEDDKKFEYVEYVYSSSSKYYDYSYGYGYGYGKSYGYKDVCVEFMFYGKDGKDYVEVVDGESFEECVGSFLMSHPSLSWNDVVDYYEC